MQLLIDQIEFANVILLNKVDLLSGEGDKSIEDQLIAIRSLIQKLNPKATVLIPDLSATTKPTVNFIIVATMRRLSYLLPFDRPVPLRAIHN